MSTRIEWHDSGYTTETVAPAGTRIGEDRIGDGNVGIVIYGDTVTVIEGTRARLTTILRVLLAELDSASDTIPPLPVLPTDDTLTKLAGFITAAGTSETVTVWLEILGGDDNDAQMAVEVGPWAGDARAEVSVPFHLGPDDDGEEYADRFRLAALRVAEWLTRHGIDPTGATADVRSFDAGDSITFPRSAWRADA